MPNLGFLKKKKTKEFNSPASPISDTTFSSGPTSSSKVFGSSIHSASSNSSYPQSSGPQSTDSTKPDESMSLIDQSSHVRDVHHPPHPPPPPPPPPQYTSAPAQPLGSSHTPGAASINNLINPPSDYHVFKDQAGLGQAQYDGQSNERVTGTTLGAAAAATATAANASATKPVPRITKGKYQLSDFSIQRTLGTGSFGRVHLVQSRHNQRFYAVKVLKKLQVVMMKQVEHTNDERRMLGLVKHPFLITLWGTFQDSRNLYMVMDFVEGGELFSLLRKSQVCWLMIYIYISKGDPYVDLPLPRPPSLSVFLTLSPNSTRRR